jgi:DNA transformation protein and related proteins
MATKQSTIDFLTEQMQKAGEITSRKMFGEYAIYCDTKVVAFVCDDQLFIKPTEVGMKFLDESHFAPAYPGSKDYLRVPEDKWDDSEWLTDFIGQTASVLPLPKPKKK